MYETETIHKQIGQSKLKTNLEISCSDGWPDYLLEPQGWAAKNQKIRHSSFGPLSYRRIVFDLIKTVCYFLYKYLFNFPTMMPGDVRFGEDVAEDISAESRAGKSTHIYFFHRRQKFLFHFIMFSMFSVKCFKCRIGYLFNSQHLSWHIDRSMK